MLPGVPVIDGVIGAVDVAVPLGVRDADDVMEGDEPIEIDAEGVGLDEPVKVILVEGVPLLEGVGVPEDVPVPDVDVVPDGDAVLLFKEITYTSMLLSGNGEASKAISDTA